jgi:hypothetical protein
MKPHSMLGLRQLLFFIFYFTVLESSSQGVFQTGFKLGLGGSVVPLYTRLEAKGITNKAYTGTTLTTGGIAQYIIGNRIGIESGMHVTHYSYYYPEDSNLWRRRLWKGAAAIEMFDFQLPVVMLYRIPMPSDPFKDITLAFGTSIDWLATDFLINRSMRGAWLKNIYGGVRLGKERMKGNRLVCGLEFQYSLDRFSLKGMNYNQQDMQISSRMSMLTINVYYFFSHKAVRDT